MAKFAKILVSLFLLIYVEAVLGVAITVKSAKNVRDRSLAECLKDQNLEKQCAPLLPYSKAGEIRAFMRPEIDPCEDFYEFSCGNWPIINKARSSPTTGFFETLAGGMRLKVARILNSTSDPTLTENERKVIRYYQSCMNLVDKPIPDYKSSFEKIIGEFGSMPALAGASWNASAFNWYETLGRMFNKYGIGAIVGVDIMTDFYNSTINSIIFGHNQLPLESKSMYISKSTEDYRLKYKAKISSQLVKYLEMGFLKANEVAGSIVEFEQKLAKGMYDDGVSLHLDESTVLITPTEMSTKYAPFLNIRRFVELAFGERVNTSIYEYNEGFQKNLGIVLDTVSKETVANYIFYRLIVEFFPKVTTNEKAQQKVCTEVVKSQFAKVLDNMIHRRYKQESTESDINAVWLKIKETFDRQLNTQSLPWISPGVLVYARKKLNNMKLEINTYMDTNFTDEMNDLNIDSDSLHYMDNLKSIFQSDVKRKIRKLHEPPSSFEAAEELSYTPVNIVTENKIKIPVSFLQPFYLWSSYYPEALMYGTLGFLLGHELLHGFDDNGRVYGETGTMETWWDKKSTDAFLNRTKCFADQYHNYVFGDNRLPLSEAQAENIADNGGLRLAYNAYLNWLHDNNDRKLPLMDSYSPKKLFFISYAQIWCNDIKPHLKLLQASTDSHTPAKFRVIGVLSNSEDFSNEFECALGTKMNPVKKCQIY